MRAYPQQHYNTDAAWDWESRFDRRLVASNLAVGLVLTLGFLARIWAASGTYLHPDEA